MPDLQAEYETGLRSLEAGAFAPALESFRAGIAAVPGNEQIRRALRRVARGAIQAATQATLDSDEAVALYRCGIDAYQEIGATIADPVDLGLLHVASFNLGSWCQRDGRNADAIRHYEDALMLSPQSEGAAGNLALLLIDAGRHEEALAVIQKGELHHPASPQLSFHRQRAEKAQRAGGTV